MANLKKSQLKNTVVLWEHEAFQAAFFQLYRQGMALIEETAVYINGEGKADSQGLAREVAALYSSEAVRMSTRLMQIASWLLLLRTQREGEMSMERVSREKAKVSLNTPSQQDRSLLWGGLPLAFCDLVDRSLRLEERVRRMDRDIDQHGTNGEQANTVNKQLERIQAVFGVSEI